MKRKNITEVTKENILKAFWKLYKQKSIDKISIREVMLTAGYHRSTFYEYFENIYDVLYTLEELILADLKQIATTVQGKSEAYLDKNTLTKITTIYVQNSEYVSVLLGEHGDPSFIKKAKEALYPIIKINFENSLLISDSNDLYETYIFEYITSVILNMINFYLNSDNKIPLDDFVIFVRGLLLNGISNFKIAPTNITI